MPKSTKFQSIEKIIADLQAAQRASIERGKKDGAVGTVAMIFKKFTTALEKSVLTEINEAGNLLILVITAFSEPVFSKILQTSLEAMLTKMEDLEIEQQVIAGMYTTKQKRMNTLKLAAIQSPEALAIILPQILDLGELNILQILTGMESCVDNTATPYTRTAAENLGSKMASLTVAQRGQLLTARDDSEDAWNVIAYAAHHKDTELLKLVFLHMTDVYEADQQCLSHPTDSPKVNASIFLYILSLPSLVALLQQLADLHTLRIMLTTRGEGGRNAVAFALENGNQKHLTALLTLANRLEVTALTEILNQLTIDTKQQLAKHPDCPKDIQDILIKLLDENPSYPPFFKAQKVTADSVTALLQSKAAFLPIQNDPDHVIPGDGGPALS